MSLCGTPFCLRYQHKVQLLMYTYKVKILSIYLCTTSILSINLSQALAAATKKMGIKLWCMKCPCLYAECRGGRVKQRPVVTKFIGIGEMTRSTDHSTPTPCVTHANANLPLALICEFVDEITILQLSTLYLRSVGQVWILFCSYCTERGATRTSVTYLYGTPPT